MKKTKILCVLLALLLLLPALPVSAATAFTDVHENNWFYEAVNYATENNLFKGTTETEFSPGQNMERGMFVTVLGRLNGVDTTAYPKTYFSDVSVKAYYSPYVQWAALYGITSGAGSFRFDPRGTVTREQIAAFMFRYAQATSNDLSYDASVLEQFPDKDSISTYAREPMAWAVSHGVIKGSGNEQTGIRLNPKGNATRSQVAQIFYNCRDLLVNKEINKEPLTLPEPPKVTYTAPTVTTAKVAGVTVKYVQLDPTKGYDVRAVLANDKLYSWEPATSIVKRSGAVAAVNGAFFQCYEGQPDFLTIYSTIISAGKLLRVDNARKKPTFTVDTDGKASIEFFTVNTTASWIHDGDAQATSIPDVGRNISVSSGSTRMIYDRTWGTTVPGKVAKALAVNSKGQVSAKYTNASKVAIPSGGYVIFEREPRSGGWGEGFFDNAVIGDKITLSTKYTGASKQNIYTALSCGPCVVKGGKAYGNSNTYAEEGFSDPAVTVQPRNRMAIGVKSNGTVVIASIEPSVILGQLSQIMLGLGCTAAMNLDGGGSTNLYANSKWLTGPTGRNMSNMLIFKKKAS